ncbi:SDR family oxidoreductase [Amycolatopsis mongoliensis]|uniref:SDR family oxidoreductase n=1 Tax=Amycolatopsis mongoliensis TaxID=715475 RepID=A0A9Y2JP81_9PSEU|nr:SDR family oxidoreductase [Amycolatopsis sp. 4-36]WIY00969.1 SDR family oxidoreductase [Amycolatopsis sp. 4-36]
MNATHSELVVVTGASTGIGRATAQRLATDGFHVLAGVRSEAAAAEVKAGRIEPVLLDITDEDQVAALADTVRADRRPLRAVVNNAGIAVNAPIEALPLAEWRRQFDVSVFGQVAVIQAFMPALLRSKGRVVNIGSTGGKVAMPSFGAYSGAKFAMEAISDSLRREVEPFGVTVAVVIPGAIRTKLAERGNATGERLIAGMTLEQRARYAGLAKAFRATTESWGSNGLDASLVADVVSKAIRARKPRTRYTVGRDAAVMTRLTHLVSDRLLDRMVRHTMGL